MNTFFDALDSDGNYVGVGMPLQPDRIRFYPRAGWTERMIGGVFEGTSGDPVTGPYQTIYTVTSDPPLAWNEIDVNLQDYRYLRYRGPNNSWGNVAEIEFYRDGAKLAGSGYGTLGSWDNQGSTLEKALDGDLNTFFDAPTGDGAYVGIDTSSGGTVPVDKIRFYPRSGWTERMIGGVFEGSSGDPTTGPYETIYTVTSNPQVAWNEANVNLQDYRYLRYRGLNNSWANVAEIEFYRKGAKLTGTAFGTPGSWNDTGNTFEKAVDGDTGTFFDAPIGEGAYVGVDSGAPGSYTIVELGSLVGDNGPGESGAMSINNSGQVVGFSQIVLNGRFVFRATLFSGRGSDNIDLGTLGGSSSLAISINDLGQIVGYADLPGDITSHATRFSGTESGNIDLGTLGGSRSAAYSINNAGQIVGSAYLPGDQTGHATLFSGTGSGNIDLGTLGGPSSVAFAINNAGQIAGTASPADSQPSHATLFGGTGSGKTDLGTLGGSGSSAVGINDAAQILGNASGPGDRTTNATIFSGTGSGNIGLGTLPGAFSSYANGLNNAGQIVGYSAYPPPNPGSSTQWRGFIHANGMMTDLATITAGAGEIWFEPAANDCINDWGQIAARRYMRAVLLNPVNPLRSTSGGVTNIKFVGGMAYQKLAALTGPDGQTSVAMLGGTAGSGGLGPHGRNRDVVVTFSARGEGNLTIASDAVNLSGTADDAFVLEVSYDESLANALFGNESEARLSWLDPQTGLWVPAVAGNSGGTPVFVGSRAYDPGSDFVLGRHGVDTAGNTVWAVVNHSGSFSVASGVSLPRDDKIRYYPRSGWTQRMVGGVFEGTNGDRVSRPYNPIYTVTSNPAPVWNEVNVSLGKYRYLRYRGPDGSHGNVAEIEFYRGGVKLAGSGFGTPGSWNNVGNSFDKALDGDVNTFFDAPAADGAFVALDAQ